jgi:hypothetical protein
VKEPDLKALSLFEWDDGEKVVNCMFALDSCAPAPSAHSCVGQWIQAACEFVGVMMIHLCTISDNAADCSCCSLQAYSVFDVDAAASRWATLLQFLQDVSSGDTNSTADEWVQLRPHHAPHITRALVATCYQISGLEVVEGGRCPRRLAARLIVSAGRCLAAVIALSEASAWRLMGPALLADVLETMRLGVVPLVNAWKLPISDDNPAADDDVAVYLGLCAQVCDAVSSFITSSSKSTPKKGSTASATLHARVVLKLQVITTAYNCNLSQLHHLQPQQHASYTLSHTQLSFQWCLLPS